MPAKKEEASVETDGREQTKDGSHIALQRGYAKGQLIERGEPVPAGVAVSTEWMAPKADAAAALAETEE